MTRILGAIVLLAVAASPTSANFGLFRRSTPVTTSYYLAPAPVTYYAPYYAPVAVGVAAPACGTAGPVAVPAVPRPPRVRVSPPVSPPPAVPRQATPVPPRPMAPASDSEAMPESAPPSPSGPIVPPSRPTPTGEPRSAFYPAVNAGEEWYSVYATDGSTNLSDGATAVTFWNLSDRPVSLRVGEQRWMEVPSGGSRLVRTTGPVRWQVAGRPIVESPNKTSAGLTVTIRR